MAELHTPQSSPLETSTCCVHGARNLWGEVVAIATLVLGLLSWALFALSAYEILNSFPLEETRRIAVGWYLQLSLLSGWGGAAIGVWRWRQILRRSSRPPWVAMAWVAALVVLTLPAGYLTCVSIANR